MKNLKYILCSGIAAVTLFTACNDLDTEYLGGYVTGEQKEDVIAMDPEMAQAGVTAIAQGAYRYMAVLSVHCDFGVPSIMMMLDSNGQDFVSANSGYNWMLRSIALSDIGQATSYETSVIWYTLYNQINTANAVLINIPGDTEDELSMFYRAQALCFRAFDYWVLSQVYQHNYQHCDPASAPCVPILTEENQELAASEGAPRATVQEVYDLIVSDLTEAIELIDASGIKASSVISSKPKRLFNLDAAYGMLARVYLTMGDYAGAQEAAANCLNITTCKPYSLEQVSSPTFISLDDSSWLWGQAVAETDRAVTSGIVNFPSMMGTFNYGYIQSGAWKWCNAKLYESIPSSDVRKGWWLDSNYESANLTDPYYTYMEDYGFTDDPDDASPIQVYTQCKFAPYNYEIDTSVNASDIPYFRIEEVYYIYYEAMAMNGNASEAATKLSTFVKTYRDPSYTCSATTPEGIQDEIWNQRRIEFWGEGWVSWFDIKRLGKPLDRVGGHYPTAFVYQIPANAQEFVLPIPQDETMTNKQLTVADNNPTWSRPTPVKE